MKLASKIYSMSQCNDVMPLIFDIFLFWFQMEKQGKEKVKLKYFWLICWSTGYYTLTFLHIFLLSFIFSPHVYRGRGQAKIQVSICANVAPCCLDIRPVQRYDWKKQREMKNQGLRLHSTSTDTQECWEETRSSHTEPAAHISWLNVSDIHEHFTLGLCM